MTRIEEIRSVLARTSPNMHQDTWYLLGSELLSHIDAHAAEIANLKQQVERLRELLGEGQEIISDLESCNALSRTETVEIMEWETQVKSALAADGERGE